jgi:Fe-S-cluster containining protein
VINKNTPLKDVLKLAPSCRCDACSHGCKYGSGLLAKGDKKNLASFLKISEKELKERFLEEVERFNTKLFRPKLIKKEKNQYGQCIFYDDKKGCTVHKAKPLECKTSMGCKDYGEELSSWFMINHVINLDDPESIRQYEQYIKAGGKVIKGGELHNLVPDKERLRKILSYEILK